MARTRTSDKDKAGTKTRSGDTRRRLRPPRSPGHPSRDRVRHKITRATNYRGVDAQLALAIAWQESGWQMHRVSSAGAIGAMQVLPGTGRWMEYYAGHDLRLRVLKDNATAGIPSARRPRRPHPLAPAPGSAPTTRASSALREHGLYDKTKAYVANVLAINKRLEAGRPPA